MEGELTCASESYLGTAHAIAACPSAALVAGRGWGRCAPALEQFP